MENSGAVFLPLGQSITSESELLLALYCQIDLEKHIGNITCGTTGLPLSCIEVLACLVLQHSEAA